MPTFTPIALITTSLTFDEILAIIGLVVNSVQALVLPITIYLLVVQTRVFIDTIYSATFQSLYDAEAHIGELMMTYPEASRILMSPKPQPSETAKGTGETVESLKMIDPELRERVRWLGTAMLDFFEHIWTQAQKGGLPKDVWEAWEDYIAKKRRIRRTHDAASNSPSFNGPSVVNTCLSRMGKRRRARITSSVVIFSTRSTSSSTLIRRPSVTQSFASERMRAKVDSLLRTRLLIHLSLARRSSSSCTPSSNKLSSSARSILRTSGA